MVLTPRASLRIVDEDVVEVLGGRDGARVRRAERAAAPRRVILRQRGLREHTTLRRRGRDRAGDTMRLDLSGPLLESLTGKRKMFFWRAILISPNAW